jgi:4-hydroxy-tetrahydrodipicolinate reductase
MISKIGVAGASGRMGKEIVKAISFEQDMELVLAVDLTHIGEDAGDIAGIGDIGIKISSPGELGQGLDESGTQILVDFTSHHAVLKNAEIALEKGVKIVIGTTGLKKRELEAVEVMVKQNKGSAVISPNMATGVNLFFKLAQEAALALGDGYDVEIVEAHHRHKKDAPSGTALRAGSLIADALGREVERDGVFGRKGVIGERSKGEIGFHAVRAGDIVGDHTVIFAGIGERIEITHRAHTRDAFVNGVIRAIRFLKNKAGEGKVYNTWDVLGIK